MFRRIALAFLFVILINCEFAVARTRYEEFEFKGCKSNLAVKRQDLASRTILPGCPQFCQASGYQYGGCDCKTEKCVCADMNLDFCNFQEIRLFI